VFICIHLPFLEWADWKYVFFLHVTGFKLCGHFVGILVDGIHICYLLFISNWPVKNKLIFLFDFFRPLSRVLRSAVSMTNLSSIGSESSSKVGLFQSTDRVNFCLPNFRYGLSHLYLESCFQDISTAISVSYSVHLHSDECN